MEQIRHQLKVCTHVPIDSSSLLAKAPKYVQKINLTDGLSPMLNKLKKIKTLRKAIKPSPGHLAREYLIQEILLKHAKVLKQDDKSMGFSPRYKVTQKVLKRQVVWDSRCLSIFSNWKEEKQRYACFATKANVYSLNFDGVSCYRASTELSPYLPKILQHIPRLKGIKYLSVNCLGKKIGENAFEFYEMLDSILPLISQKAKIRLILDSHYMASKTSSLYQLLSLNNIFHTITHLELVHMNMSERKNNMDSLVTFIASFTKLESVKINYPGANQTINNLLEDLYSTLNEIETLKVLDLHISSIYNTRSSISWFDFASLSVYCDLLYRLEEINISFPVLSFECFDLGSNRQTFRAKKISLAGQIVCWKGFRSFLQKINPDTYEGSSLCLNLYIKNSAYANSLFRALATRVMMETVTIQIRGLDSSIYGKDLLDCLSQITGPKELMIYIQSESALRHWARGEILDILADSEGQLQKVKFETEGCLWCSYGYCQAHESLERLSYLEFVLDNQNYYRVATKFFDECTSLGSYYYYYYYYDYDCEGDDFDQEEIDIPYFDPRHRPTERKKNKKLFTEYRREKNCQPIY